MIKNDFKKEKGITLISLVITVLVLVIITTVLALNSYDALQMSNLTKLQNDIEAISDRVAAYFVKEDKLPIEEGKVYKKGTLKNEINDLSNNDGDNYYKIDLSKLDNLTLNNNKSNDEYIINEETHIVYYRPGINYKGTMYHTFGAGE